MKHLLLALPLLTIIACGSADPTPSPTAAAQISAPLSGGAGTGGGTGGRSTPCWDGVTFPRPAMEPVALSSVAAKYAAYDLALADYQVAAAAYSALAEEYATAFNAAAAPVAGRLCTTALDCDTGSTRFPGICIKAYYGVGSHCYAAETGTAPSGGPVPPTVPVITCADLSCATFPGFACETEPTTGTNACIESRCVTGGKR